MHRDLVGIAFPLLCAFLCFDVSCGCSAPTNNDPVLGVGGHDSMSSGGRGGDGSTGGTGGSAFPPCGSTGPLANSTAAGGGQQWLDSPDAWRLIPAAPGVLGPSCSISESVPEEIRAPVVEWVDCDPGCGGGCARARLDQDLGSDILSAVGDVIVSTSIRDGESAVFASVTHAGHNDTKRLRLVRIVSLETGETVAAIQASSVRTSSVETCAPQSEQSALWTRIWGQGPLEFVASGGLDVMSKRFTWQLPLREQSTSEWGCPPLFVESGARTFFLCPGAIAAATKPGSSDLSFLSTPGPDYVPVAGASDGASAFWAEVRIDRLGSRIQGWMPEDGRVRIVLADVPGDTCGLAVSPSQVVGLAYMDESGGGCENRPDGPRFWLVDRLRSESVVRTGPFLPGDRSHIKSMSIWGDFVAAVLMLPPGGEPSERKYVVLARLSDWSLRRLDSPVGAAINDVALTSRALYLSTIPDASPYRAAAGDVYRFDLSRFSDIGRPIE